MQSIFTPKQIEQMNTALTEPEIETKQGARYIKGSVAISKANRIFGAGNWGYMLSSGIDVIDTGKTNSNSNKIYRVRVAVTLQVRDCMPITEIGDCDAQGEGAAAMSMAEKGAVTDGLKRCLKNYGPAFGLDLYAKCPKCEKGIWEAKEAVQGDLIIYGYACKSCGHKVKTGQEKYEPIEAE
jgi:recombination DNA repair RAD52 pathway protein